MGIHVASYVRFNAYKKAFVVVKDIEEVDAIVPVAGFIGVAANSFITSKMVSNVKTRTKRKALPRE
jgi:hypothetical protein